MTNRFKGLDLLDRVPKELWMEVRNIAQETVTRIFPKEKKCKKAKWLSEEALQIAEERRDMKGKVEKEKIYLTECRVPEKKQGVIKRFY